MGRKDSSTGQGWRDNMGGPFKFSSSVRSWSIVGLLERTYLTYLTQQVSGSIISRLRTLPGWPGQPVLFWSWGAHEAAAMRLVARDPAYQSEIQRFIKKVPCNGANRTELRPNATWEQIRFVSMNMPGPNSKAKTLCTDLSRKVWSRWIDVMKKVRASGFTGAIIMRNVQINWGFDFFGRENCVKLMLNEFARNTFRDDLEKLRVTTLDVEAMTASRPETFVNEHTNHFYCECDGIEKERCRSTSCLLKRRDFYENGEANRYIAQFTLNILDRL